MLDLGGIHIGAAEFLNVSQEQDIPVEVEVLAIAHDPASECVPEHACSPSL